MLFADSETTGLLKPDAITKNLQPFITEIYVIKLTDDLEVVDELETFIKPPIPIEEHITHITGITDETVANAPSFISIYPQLVELFLGERVIVGHNISFDLGVIYCELSRCDKEFHFPWPQEWICTVEKSFPIENRRLTLTKLHEHATGVPHEEAHRAKADVMALIRCYVWLQEQGLV